MKKTVNREEASKMSLVRFDWFMKKMMRDKSDFSVLEGFLSALTQKDLKIVNLLESESNKSDKEDKYNRVDIMVEDEFGDKIIVEIQRQSEYDYFHRMLFGTSKVITDNMNQGYEYAKVPKVISISILYFDLTIGEDYLYYGTTEFFGTHTSEKLQTKYLMDKSNITRGKKDPFPEYYFINVNKFKNIVEEDIDEWIYMLKNSEIKKEFKSKGIELAGERLDFENLTADEKHNYNAHMKSLSVENSMFETAIHDGLEQGLEQGLTQGLEQGLTQGREKEKREITEKMIRCKIDDNLIVESTGLSMVEINEIKKVIAN